MRWDLLIPFVGLFVAVWMFTSNPPRSYFSVLGLVLTLMSAVRITALVLIA